jgi:hypothetical protein
MTSILGRFPRWAQIIPVFGVIVLVIYTWTLMWFFWEVPSWLYYLRTGEILSLLAYAFATNLAESLAVLCGPLLLALLLPRKWFSDVFVARGAAVSLAGLGCAIFLAQQFTDKNAYPSFWLKVPTLAAVAAAIGVIAYLCGRIRLVRTVLEAIADRVSIFAYIAAPLGVISLVVVGVRLLTP